MNYILAIRLFRPLEDVVVITHRLPVLRAQTWEVRRIPQVAALNQAILSRAMPLVKAALPLVLPIKSLRTDFSLQEEKVLTIVNTGSGLHTK